LVSPAAPRSPTSPREFDLGAAGYTVLRYTEAQLAAYPDEIAAEIASFL
jgi:hypothetical protein